MSLRLEKKTIFTILFSRSKRRILKSELKNLTAEDLSIVMSKVTDGTALRSSLEKQEKALVFMQQETLQIMRMYL